MNFNLNLEKDTVDSLHEYELDIGDMEKITKESKRCFSHGFTVPEETESKPLPAVWLSFYIYKNMPFSIFICA
jgi:hypothetical protein